MASQPGSLEGAWGLVEDDRSLEEGHVMVSPELELCFVLITAVLVEDGESKLRASTSASTSSKVLYSMNVCIVVLLQNRK